MAGEHFPVECSKCGSRQWKIYQSKGGSVSVKCSCGRQVSIECRVEPLAFEQPIQFFIQKETSEADIRIANIPRGIDPETMLTDPANVVKI